MIRAKERKNFEFDARYTEIISRLKDICALSTDTKVIEEALVFLAWAAGEANKGYKIGSYDEDKQVLRELMTPALKMASQWSPPSTAEVRRVAAATA